MPEKQQHADQILVALRDKLALIRVMERGSFKVSSAMKTFGAAAADKGVNRLIMDMSDCIGMDSTFMGVIAGLASRLKHQTGGKIYMINLHARTQSLLSTLGLDRIVETYLLGREPKDIQVLVSHETHLDNLSPEDRGRQETASLMLEAHENLVALSEKNRPKFKDVLTFLREDLKKGNDT